MAENLTVKYDSTKVWSEFNTHNFVVVGSIQLNIELYQGACSGSLLL